MNVDLTRLYFSLTFRFIALLVSGLFFVSGTAQETPSRQVLEEELLETYTTYIEDAMERWLIPGAAVAIVQDGELVYAEGFGVHELGKDTPVTPDSLFLMGSMTKSVSDTLVASLVDDDFLDWDTHASEIWPDFKLADAEVTSQVTVRDLLSMRAGLRDGDPLWEGKALSAEELMAATAQAPLEGQPGERFVYDNVSMAVGTYLGVLAADETAANEGRLFEAYADLMQARIFDPIGMTSATLYPLDEMVDHQQAWSHFMGEAGQHEPAAVFLEGSISKEGIIPAGGMAASANDIARYLITQLNQGVAPSGERVVSAENLSETWTPQGAALEDFFSKVYFPTSFVSERDTEVNYGMGWFTGSYQGIPVLLDPGDERGFSNIMALLPDANIGMVILTNSETLPCARPMTLAAQYRFVELLYGLEHQIDGLIDDIREEVGISCDAGMTQAGSEADLATALQGLLDSQVQQQDILGMAMMVRAADGTVIGGTSGYVDPLQEEAWTVDTPTSIGSVTKTYVAVVVMQMVEERKLSLEDTIDTWFPDQPNAENITVRMLLSHTSWLANFISAENVTDGTWSRPWTPEALVAEANKLAPVSEPGSPEAHYANTNYILLAMMSEQLTGNSWTEEIRTRIIEPLDLQQTTFLSAEGVLDNLIGGYSHTETGYQNLFEMPWYPHPSTSGAAGEIVSSASDLMTFATALFGDQLLSKETFVEMIQPVGTDVESGMMWGLGGGTLEQFGLRFYGMGGDIPGFHAFFIGSVDNDLLVVAVTNTEEGDVIGPSMGALEYMASLGSTSRRSVHTSYHGC